MEITYKVEPEDFVAFNLSYMQGSPVMRKNIRTTRLVSAGLILIGGCILMEVLGALNAVSAVVYAALAVAVYVLTPRLMERRVRKGGAEYACPPAESKRLLGQDPDAG